MLWGAIAHMPRLTFLGADNHAGYALEAPTFLLTGACLQLTPHGEVVAKHIEKNWHVSQQRYIRFECVPQVICCYEVEGEVHGPFEAVGAVNGILWAGPVMLATLRGNYWMSGFTGRQVDRIRLEQEVP